MTLSSGHLKNTASLSACHRYDIKVAFALSQNFVLLNCHSLTEKAYFLPELIADIQLDMLLLTETWQLPNDFYLNLLTHCLYKYLSKPHLCGVCSSLS